MNKIFSNRKIFIFLALTFLFISLNFIPGHLADIPTEGHKWEKFDKNLAAKLNTVNSLLAYTDSIAHEQKVATNGLAYANILNDVVKKRFYHGYSHYSTKENWIASLSGKLFWSHLSAIVLPNDLMKYEMAACSQQSIVLMECFKRKQITFRKIGFDHHFAVEANFDGKWYFFDPDMEPDFSKVPRTNIASLIKDQQLFSIYKDRLNAADIKYGLANQFYGKVNEWPAKNASIFHSFTKVLSKIFWLLPLLAFLIIYLRKGQLKTYRTIPDSRQHAW